MITTIIELNYNQNMKIIGKVIKGKQQARLQGYPTANIVSAQLLPEHVGTWVGVITIDEWQKKYFVGKVPPIGGLIEAHIYDFDKDIYNCEIELELSKQLPESGDLYADVVAGKRRCSTCMYCDLEDYGYSAYTVLGTTSKCSRDLRSEFDQEYNPQVEDLFAVTCSKYRGGEPREIKLEE